MFGVHLVGHRSHIRFSPKLCTFPHEAHNRRKRKVISFFPTFDRFMLLTESNEWLLNGMGEKVVFNDFAPSTHFMCLSNVWTVFWNILPIKFNDDPSKSCHRLQHHKNMENVINEWTLLGYRNHSNWNLSRIPTENMENRCLTLYVASLLGELIMKTYTDQLTRPTTNYNMLTEKLYDITFLPHQHKVVPVRIYGFDGGWGKQIHIDVKCSLDVLPQKTIGN